MNPRLGTYCVTLWLLGLFGMGVARGLLGYTPGNTPFDLCAMLWVLGWLGYGFLGALVLSERTGSE